MIRTYRKKRLVYLGSVLLFLFCLANDGLLWAQPYHNPSVAPNMRVTTPDPLLVKEYMLDGPGSINVFTISGDIDLVSTPDTRKVRIELYADRSFSIWPVGNPFENYRITSLKRGNEITTSVEKKSGNESSFWGGQPDFSYKIMVPEYISTTLKTSNGHITVRHVRGDQNLNSNVGNITVSDVRGSIKAYTSGGNVKVDDAQGMIYAKTSGGNVQLHHAEGDIRIKVYGGKITSSATAGSMIAKVYGGDIEAQFERAAEGINLETYAGNISVIVPEMPGTGYGVFMQAQQIHFNPTERFQGTLSQSRADGSLNGGGIPLSLTANAGTVTLQLKK